jgi:hypothetical protein
VIDKLREQIDELVNRKVVAHISAEQLIVTLIGSCLFPFAARPS